MLAEEMKALKMLGMSPEEIMTCGKCLKGYPFTSNANASLDIQINIPGNARVLLGFAVVDTIDNDFVNQQYTLNLNNELIVDRVDLAFCTPNQRSLQPFGYVECMRRLTGKDSLVFSVQAIASRTSQLTIYYLNQFKKF